MDEFGGYICPYCGEALEYGEQVCPSCGSAIDPSFYDTTQTGEVEYADGGTRIVAVDPQMDKGTRIVRNPLHEVRFHKIRHKKEQEVEDQPRETDDLAALAEWMKYVYVRLNKPERWALWLLIAGILFSVSPWYHNETYQSLVSGYEEEGFWSAILGALSAGMLTGKIHFRWGWWSSLVSLVIAGGAAAIPFYAYMRGSLPKLTLLPGVHLSMVSLGLATFLLLVGAIKRAL